MVTVQKLVQHFMRKILYYFSALLLLLYYILATNLGLQSIFWLTKLFIPGTLSASHLAGSLITPIEIKDFQYESTENNFKSTVIRIDLKLHALLNNTIDIPLLTMQNAELKLFNHEPLIIYKASCTFKRQFRDRLLEIKIPEFDAQWKEKPLHIFLGIRLLDKKIDFLNDLSVAWGKNQFNIRHIPHPSTLKKSEDIQDVMKYVIHLEEPTYSGRIQGTLSSTLGHAQWLGNIESVVLQLPIGTQWSTKQVSQFQFSADAFQLDKIGLACQHCQSGNYRFKNLNGSLSMAWQGDHFRSHFELKENGQNFINGQIHIDQTLHGFLKGQIQDLHPLYSLFPQIAKIKGLVDIDGKLSGTIQKPLFHLTLKSPSTQFLIPKYKLQVTHFNFQIQGDMPGTLSIKGQGLLGEGLFKLEGDFYAFNAKDNPHLLTMYLKGNHLSISNQAHCFIIASPDLSIKYEKNKNLLLDGIVKIDSANIHLDEQAKQLTFSRDVVIVHAKTDPFRKNLPSTLKITPNIQFIVENNTHIQGYGLIGTVGGKLQVEERADGLLVGTGRLTIKEGRYRLQGKNRYIHRGRLLFPQGTLLTDPLLDIKITDTKIGEIEADTDAGIYVQGTLKNPIYQLYSASAMNNAEILSKLGLGIEEVNPETTQKKLSMTKPASFLAGSNPFIDKLSSLLGLEELSVTTRETESSQQNLSKTDTVLVVGKWLTDRLYIEYFQSILEPISTAKVRYRLNKEFTASIESGTEGQGADLIYSIERD